MSSIALKRKEKDFQNRQVHNAGQKVHIVESDIGSLKVPGVASQSEVCAFRISCTIPRVFTLRMAVTY